MNALVTPILWRATQAAAAIPKGTDVTTIVFKPTKALLRGKILEQYISEGKAVATLK